MTENEDVFLMDSDDTGLSHRLLKHKLLKHKLLSGGHAGWIFGITDHIALKIPTEQSRECFDRESRFYDTLENHEPCSYILQSFLCVPEGNFLALMSGGTLQQRLESNKNWTNGAIIGFKLEPLALVERWFIELSGAVAWLEYIQCAHDDIRPSNLLLDAKGHLRLAAFNHAAPVGTPSHGGKPPWTRLLGDEGGSAKNTFGLCGPRTEQFAVGSILYYLTRGYEPFEMSDMDYKAIGNCLQRMDFPLLGEGLFDGVIDRCWNGQFTTLKQISDLAKPLIDLGDPVRISRQYCSEKREECEKMVDDGLLEA
ncbi:hypothetical protein BDV18DRAFT_157596 [Aspergillus unguis]